GKFAGILQGEIRQRRSRFVCLCSWFVRGPFGNACHATYGKIGLRRNIECSLSEIHRWREAIARGNRHTVIAVLQGTEVFCLKLSRSCLKSHSDGISLNKSIPQVGRYHMGRKEQVQSKYQNQASESDIKNIDRNLPTMQKGLIAKNWQ